MEVLKTHPERKSSPAHERKKPDRDGKDKIQLPDDLPVQTTILDIPEEQKVCQETGQHLNMRLIKDWQSVKLLHGFSALAILGGSALRLNLAIRFLESGY